MTHIRDIHFPDDWYTKHKIIWLEPMKMASACNSLAFDNTVTWLMGHFPQSQIQMGWHDDSSVHSHIADTCTSITLNQRITTIPFLSAAVTMLCIQFSCLSKFEWCQQCPHEFYSCLGKIGLYKRLVPPPIKTSIHVLSGEELWERERERLPHDHIQWTSCLIWHTRNPHFMDKSTNEGNNSEFIPAPTNVSSHPERVIQRIYEMQILRDSRKV